MKKEGRAACVSGRKPLSFTDPSVDCQKATIYFEDQSRQRRDILGRMNEDKFVDMVEALITPSWPCRKPRLGLDTLRQPFAVLISASLRKARGYVDLGNT